MRMKRLLGTEWEAFQASYDKERSYGLRRNPLKSSGERFMAQMPYTLEKVSWAEEGYYYQAEEQPGKDVLHEARADIPTMRRGSIISRSRLRWR